MTRCHNGVNPSLATMVIVKTGENLIENPPFAASLGCKRHINRNHAIAGTPDYKQIYY